MPDKLGDFEAAGELDGSTSGMGNMQVSKVSRRYKSGDTRLRLQITDTSLVPMLRAGFAMAAQVQQRVGDAMEVAAEQRVAKYAGTVTHGILEVLYVVAGADCLRSRP